jgi:hypothetical protein
MSCQDSMQAFWNSHFHKANTRTQAGFSGEQCRTGIALRASQDERAAKTAFVTVIIAFWQKMPYKVLVNELWCLSCHSFNYTLKSLWKRHAADTSHKENNIFACLR